jgi:nickel-dependent lactate racemase
MIKQYYLTVSPYKKEPFTLPPAWVPVHVLEPQEAIRIPHITHMTTEALTQAEGTPPFSALAAGAKRVVIIVDDATRPTPVAEILPVLLSALAEADIPRERIAILIALGTHVRMQQPDLEKRFGSMVVREYRIIQHDAWQADLVPITLPDGRIVKINPEVIHADLTIGISSILPHPMAGYGGGPKIIMPGLCNFEFIRDHHMRYSIHQKSRAGNIEGNPFHAAVWEVARAVGLSLSINCVYNQEGQVIRIIAGDLEGAFAKAVSVCVETLGHRFPEPVDVTITSTYPHIHGHQFPKGLSAPDRVTKDTGAILLFAPLVTPVLEEFRNSFTVVQKKSGNRTAAFVIDAMSRGLPFLPERPLEFNMAMSCMILRPSIRTIMVSPLVTKEEAQTMGLEYASSITEGLRHLEQAYPQATVAIFPSGGFIVPITAWN